jgi:hypothetical protein
MCATASSAALADDVVTSGSVDAGDSAVLLPVVDDLSTVEAPATVADAAATDATDVLADLVPELPTESDGLIDALVGDTAATLDGVLDTGSVVVTLPTGDSSTATLTDSDTGQTLSVTPSGTANFDDDSAVAVADVPAEDASVLVQATTTGSLQALKVFNDGGDSASFDLAVTKPDTTEWLAQEDGSLYLVSTSDAGADATADPLAVVAAPWAIDAAGQSLPTSYTVTSDGIEQVVDTTDAVYPVVADPSWWWWAAKIAGCAAELATIAAVAAKLLTVLARSERVIKASRTALAAYNKIGGTVDKLWTYLKKFVMDRAHMTTAQVAAIRDLLKQVGSVIFNIIGIGTCWDIANEYI